MLLFVFFLAAESLAGEPAKWAQMQRAVLVEQDLEKVKALVASGVDPNAPIGCGDFAPLDGAISKANPDMAALLLSRGARPMDRQIVSAAFAADHDAALQIVRMLHAAGVSVNAREYYLKDTERYSTPIHQAVWRENTALISYLIEQRGIQLDLPNVDGYSPLMIAVEKGSDEIVQMLLAAGADPKRRNNEGIGAAQVADRVIERQRLFLDVLREAPRSTAKLSSNKGSQDVPPDNRLQRPVMDKVLASTGQCPAAEPGR